MHHKRSAISNTDALCRSLVSRPGQGGKVGMNDDPKSHRRRLFNCQFMAWKFGRSGSDANNSRHRTCMSRVIGVFLRVWQPFPLPLPNRVNYDGNGFRSRAKSLRSVEGAPGPIFLHASSRPHPRRYGITHRFFPYWRPYAPEMVSLRT
jgi:hypothetical protein